MGATPAIAVNEVRAGAEPRTGIGLGRSVALTTAALAIGRLAALVAGIATVSLASHQLGLARFGALSAGMAYASLFAVLTDLGLSTVATRELSLRPEREASILGNLVAVGSVLAVAAAVLGAAIMEVAYAGPSHGSTRTAILLLLSQVLVAPVTGAARAFFTARQRGHLVAAGDVTLAVGMAAATALVVVLGLGFQAVVLAVVSGYVLQAVVMAGLARRAGASVHFAAAGGGALVWAALPLAGTLIVNYLYFRLDVFLLSWLKTDVAVARYSLAYRVLEGLMVLPSYLMLALFPTIARGETDLRELRGVLGSALTVMQAAALPLAGLMAIFAPDIVVVLGGRSYAAAGPVLALLALALAISYLAGVYGNALLALGRQRTMFVLSLPVLTVNLVANLLLIPPFGIDGAALAVAASEVVGLLIVRTYLVRLVGRPTARRPWRILAAGVALVPVAVLRILWNPVDHHLVVVLLGGALGVVMYAAALLFLGGLPAALVDVLPLPRSLIRRCRR